MKQAIVIHSDMRAGVRVMTDEQAGELFKAACAWADGEEPEIKNEAVRPFWALMRVKLSEYADRYQARCDQNRRNRTTVNDHERTRTNTNKSPKTKTKTKTKDSLRESPLTPKGEGEWFDVTFWPAYPRKVAKEAARKAAAKVLAAGVDPAEVMAGLEAARASEQWTRDGGRYVPHPATWLNGRRWEDEATAEDFEATEKNKKCGVVSYWPPPEGMMYE